MKASDVSFTTSPDSQTLIFQHAYDCTLQMRKSTISISERFFQSLHFLIDKYLPGNEWSLSGEATIVFIRA